jgi:DNA-binding response OmpR family regulator
VAKVLLIDDDSDMVTVLTLVLRGDGHEVQLAGDGAQALELLRSFRPDLIVTDIMLPKMDGWKFCQKVKEDPAGRGIPILVLTGKTEAVDELMSYESGADAYLPKPFDNAVLLETVKKLTARPA